MHQLQTQNPSSFQVVQRAYIQMDRDPLRIPPHSSDDHRGVPYGNMHHGLPSGFQGVSNANSFPMTSLHRSIPLSQASNNAQYAGQRYTYSGDVSSGYSTTAAPPSYDMSNGAGYRADPSQTQSMQNYSTQNNMMHAATFPSDVGHNDNYMNGMSNEMMSVGCQPATGLSNMQMPSSLPIVDSRL